MRVHVTWVKSQVSQIIRSGDRFRKAFKSAVDAGPKRRKKVRFEFMRGKCTQGLGENCSRVGENRPTAASSLNFFKTRTISLVSWFSFFWRLSELSFLSYYTTYQWKRLLYGSQKCLCSSKKRLFLFCFVFFCFSGVNSAVRIGIQKNEDGSFTNTDEAFKTPHVSDTVLDLIPCKSRKVGVTPLLWYTVKTGD